MTVVEYRVVNKSSYLKEIFQNTSYAFAASIPYTTETYKTETWASVSLGL